MEITKRNELEACIKQYFTEAIKGSDDDNAYFQKAVLKDQYNEALPCIIVQWWYCEEYNKVYIYYDIGKVYFIGNKDDLEKRINTRILSSMKIDLGINPEIVSNVIYGGQYLEPLDSPFVFSDENITLGLLTYWKIFDDNYHFIHDTHIILNKILDNNMVVTKEKEALINEYISKLSIIAKNYYSYDPELRNERIPDVFRDIQHLFSEYFGYDLPDPTNYAMIHPNCGPNYLYIDVYAFDEKSGKYYRGY